MAAPPEGGKQGQDPHVYRDGQPQADEDSENRHPHVPLPMGVFPRGRCEEHANANPPGNLELEGASVDWGRGI
jgi:hypothetical protein